eukprot:TRINITY_DN3904_c0_g1_i1.p1 TRINITY_DN3904_c0_g1~~TRINITY_DN3904_c0_g1_i1.p1  ORF type:complete len:1474 (+),score=323.61 TRINITY_DN3904_c0_g1_i1:280-4701(+)
MRAGPPSGKTLQLAIVALLVSLDLVAPAADAGLQQQQDANLQAAAVGRHYAGVAGENRIMRRQRQVQVAAVSSAGQVGLRQAAQSPDDQQHRVLNYPLTQREDGTVVSLVNGLAASSEAKREASEASQTRSSSTSQTGRNGSHPTGGSWTPGLEDNNAGGRSADGAAGHVGRVKQDGAVGRRPSAEADLIDAWASNASEPHGYAWRHATQHGAGAGALPRRGESRMADRAATAAARASSRDAAVLHAAGELAREVARAEASVVAEQLVDRLVHSVARDAAKEAAREAVQEIETFARHLQEESRAAQKTTGAASDGDAPRLAEEQRQGGEGAGGSHKADSSPREEQPGDTDRAAAEEDETTTSTVAAVASCEIATAPASWSSCSREGPLVGSQPADCNVLPDANITASSSTLMSENGTMSNSRINSEGEAWETKGVTNEWLQWDFGADVEISRISTRGGDPDSAWVSEYMLQTSLDGSSFDNYPAADAEPRVFVGNSDPDAAKRNDINPTIKARVVRLIPVKWKKHIALRAELYGCKAGTGLAGAGDGKNTSLNSPVDVATHTVLVVESQLFAREVINDERAKLCPHKAPVTFSVAKATSQVTEDIIVNMVVNFPSIYQPTSLANVVVEWTPDNRGVPASSSSALARVQAMLEANGTMVGLMNAGAKLIIPVPACSIATDSNEAALSRPSSQLGNASVGLLEETAKEVGEERWQDQHPQRMPALGLMIEEEAKAYEEGLRLQGEQAGMPGRTYNASASKALPESFDWRATSAACLDYVHSQGDCGASYMFAAVDSMADRHCINSRSAKPTSSLGHYSHLSVQMGLLCEPTGRQCSGGYAEIAFKFATEHGFQTEAKWPYERSCLSDAQCDFGSQCMSMVAVQCTNFFTAWQLDQISSYHDAYLFAQERCEESNVIDPDGCRAWARDKFLVAEIGLATTFNPTSSWCVDLKEQFDKHLLPSARNLVAEVQELLHDAEEAAALSTNATAEDKAAWWFFTRRRRTEPSGGIAAGHAAKVVIEFTLENLDYGLLTDSNKDELRSAVESHLATATSADVSKIHVQLLPGSVAVKATQAAASAEEATNAKVLLMGDTGSAATAAVVADIQATSWVSVAASGDVTASPLVATVVLEGAAVTNGSAQKAEAAIESPNKLRNTRSASEVALLCDINRCSSEPRPHLISGFHYVFNKKEVWKEELYSSGPFYVSFNVYEDFPWFFRYFPTHGYLRSWGILLLGGHASALVGWQSDCVIHETPMSPLAGSAGTTTTAEDFTTTTPGPRYVFATACKVLPPHSSTRQTRITTRLPRRLQRKRPRKRKRPPKQPQPPGRLRRRRPLRPQQPWLLKRTRPPSPAKIWQLPRGGPTRLPRKRTPPRMLRHKSGSRKGKRRRRRDRRVTPSRSRRSSTRRRQRTPPGKRRKWWSVSRPRQRLRSGASSPCSLSCPWSRWPHSEPSLAAMRKWTTATQSRPCCSSGRCGRM